MATPVRKTWKRPRVSLDLRPFPVAKRRAKVRDKSVSRLLSPFRDITTNVFFNTANRCNIDNSCNNNGVDNCPKTPGSDREFDLSSGEISPALTLTPSPVSEGRFDFDLSTLKIRQRLGRGGFGTVYLATIGGHKVAVKTFHACSQNQVQACRESYERELHVLRRGLDHHNLVRLLAATCTEGWVPGAQLIMEYAGCSTLQSILDDDTVRLDMYDRVLFGVQMVSGLQYLHDNGLLHLDLKPANVLFGSDGVLRLADFGTCHVHGTPWLSCLLGTPAFRAPELFHDAEPSPASDVFSLGVTFWCMDTQRHPHFTLSPEAVIYGVRRGKLRPHLPTEATSDWRLTEFRALYCRCWADEASERPPLEQIGMILESLEPPGTRD